jgi:hypothetical protein
MKIGAVESIFTAGREYNFPCNFYILHPICKTLGKADKDET